MNPSCEKITFEIELTSIFWDQPPKVEILLDNCCKFNDYITDQTGIIKFNHELEFEKSHSLVINRYNKTPEQCQNGKDQILFISKIIIDGINIENFILNRATFQPVYPEPWASQQRELGQTLETSLLGETCLGHNGQWCFNFTAPFWQFLMRAMN